MRQQPDPLTSMLADGEAPATLSHRLADPAIRAEVDEIRRMSEALRVPDDVARPDPFFVARFQQRRDALVAAAQSAQSWRQAARYLLPLAASALIGAAVAVWASGQRTNALSELEMLELGNGVADVTFETTSVEPVLRIALGEL